MGKGRGDDIPLEVRACVCVCVCALCNFPFTPTSTTVEALSYAKEEVMTSSKRYACVCVRCAISPLLPLQQRWRLCHTRRKKG